MWKQEDGKVFVLKDGSTKLIFHEDDRLNVLAKLIQEYLGKDCEELFYNIFEDKYARVMIMSG